jgi:uncharacterized protein (TIGR02246 family)
VFEQTAVDERSRNAVYALLSGIKAGWAAGDVEKFAQAFSEDAIFVPFNGLRLNGRNAILSFHVYPFATEFRGSKLEIDIVEIRALKKGIFLVSTNGGPLREGEAHCTPETQTFVIEEVGDRWAVVFFQNTPVLPARNS